MEAIQGRGNVFSDGIQIESEDQMLGKDDFLKLLMVQMQYQDPLDPMMDQEFVAQMAQFSSLEQMLQLNQNFSDYQKMQQYSQLSSLINQEVTARHPETGDEFSGTVTGISFGDEKPVLRIGEVQVELDRLISIGDVPRGEE